MIVTELKPKQEIIEAVNGRSPVFLIGCADCAAFCKTGGEKELKELADFLSKQGIKISGYCLPDAPCIAVNIKNSFVSPAALQAIEQSAAVLVLACGLGVQSAKANLRKDLPVLAACNSLYPGVCDAKGIFHKECVFCGDCSLSFTEALCPLALCPKGILNGPCGGMSKGKCELDKQKDCVWAVIYSKAKEKGNLSYFKKIHPARDHSLGERPASCFNGVDHPGAMH